MRFHAQAVRHTESLFYGGVGGAFVGMFLVGLLVLMGWFLTAVGLFVAGFASIVAFGVQADGYLRATSHALRVGRVERPRAEWGRFEVVRKRQELILNHVRDGQPREWWAFEPKHEARVRWFVDQVARMQAAEAGSEEAVPEGLRAIRGSRQAE